MDLTLFLYVASGVGLEWQPAVIELTAFVTHYCVKPIDLPPDQKSTFIMFDMETTDHSE